MTAIDLQTRSPRIHVASMPEAQPEIINGVWSLARDTCTPSQGFIGTHLPTTWQGTWSSKACAKRYFNRPMAEQMKMIRDTAEHTLRREFVLQEDKYRARQVLAILNGAPILASTPGVNVLDYTYPYAKEAVYRCYCGGYLAEDRRTHVNACEVCYSIDGPVFPRRAGMGLQPRICENKDWHKACLRPAAAHCQHATCVAVADPSVKCEHGHEHSCGSHGC